MVLKSHEVLIHVATWRNLESIMRSERSQAQKMKQLYDSIYMEYPEEANLWRQRVETVVSLGLGEETVTGNKFRLILWGQTF